MKVEKCAARTRARARSSASAAGVRGVLSTRARAASICIRLQAMVGVRVKRGDQEGNLINVLPWILNRNCVGFCFQA